MMHGYFQNRQRIMSYLIHHFLCLQSVSLSYPCLSSSCHIHVVSRHHGWPHGQGSSNQTSIIFPSPYLPHASATMVTKWTAKIYRSYSHMDRLEFGIDQQYPSQQTRITIFFFFKKKKSMFYTVSVIPPFGSNPKALLSLLHHPVMSSSN